MRSVEGVASAQIKANQNVSAGVGGAKCTGCLLVKN